MHKKPSAADGRMLAKALHTPHALTLALYKHPSEEKLKARFYIAFSNAQDCAQACGFMRHLLKQKARVKKHALWLEHDEQHCRLILKGKHTICGFLSLVKSGEFGSHFHITLHAATLLESSAMADQDIYAQPAHIKIFENAMRLFCLLPKAVEAGHSPSIHKYYKLLPEDPVTISFTAAPQQPLARLIIQRNGLAERESQPVRIHAPQQEMAAI